MSTATANWPTKPLGEVAKIERNSVPPEKIKGGSLYVGLENMTGDGEFAEVRKVENGELASNKFSFTPKHVLYGKLRPYLSKIARPGFSGICSTDILPILAGDKVDRGFLYYFLRQPKMVQHATTRSTGANLPRLSPTQLAQFPVPLPKLEEQEQIAVILDKAGDIRRKRQQAPSNARAAVFDFFVDLFGDPIANRNGYDIVPISEVATVITGNTPSRKEPANYGDDMEWIKSDNINTPFHFLTEASERLSAEGVKKSRTAPSGATLVTCIAGTPDCIGNAALAIHSVAFNQQINAVVPGDRLIDKFLYSMIVVLKPAIQQLSSKSMKGMVNKGRFETLKVVVPPLLLQEKFVRQFDVLVRMAKKMDSAAQEADDLFNSLVQRAFRGEL